MRNSNQFIGVLIMMAVGFGVMRFAPAEGPTRALLLALVIVVGGGVMALLRSRRATNRRS
jgi:hypothetical protein